MTRIRQQFNPSTLKAMRDIATGKTMTVDLDVADNPCECPSGSTPKFVDVTFSGIKYGSTDCCWNAICPLGNSVALLTNPNTTWRIKYNGKVGDVCTWIKNFTINHRVWANDDCTGETFDSDMAFTLQLDLDIGTSGLILTFDSGFWVPECYWWTPGIFTGTGIVESGCVNDTITNDWSSCKDNGTGGPAAWAFDGTATIAQV